MLKGTEDVPTMDQGSLLSARQWQRQNYDRVNTKHIPFPAIGIKFSGYPRLKKTNYTNCNVIRYKKKCQNILDIKRGFNLK